MSVDRQGLLLLRALYFCCCELCKSRCAVFKIVVSVYWLYGIIERMAEGLVLRGVLRIALRVELKG